MSPPPSSYTAAQVVNWSLHQLAHERLRKLQELDEATKVPFILIELTGEADGEGGVEIAGKDEYGVYAALDIWLMENWKCEPLDVGDLTEDTKIPFCKAAYRWPGYCLRASEDGLNNFGLRTMQIIDFMCGQLSWTLAIVNGGSLGKHGEVREQQLIFKSPHPMNLVAPHMMIELRSAGYIEVSADLEDADRDVLEFVDEFMSGHFKAEKLDGYEDFCTNYYKVGEGVFNVSGEANNLGMLTTQLCDRVVDCKGWSLVACNAGSYAGGQHREAQLVFRRDYHPLGDEEYLMVQLASDGCIEVVGKDQRNIFRKITNWLQKYFGAEVSNSFQDGDTTCTRLVWKVQDIMTSSAALTSFFEMQGWEMQVCSRQMITEAKAPAGAGEDADEVELEFPETRQVEEQLLMFRPGASEVGTIEPHLFIEFYAGEGDERFYEDEDTTQVLANQRIRVKTLSPRNGEGKERMNAAMEKIDDFIVNCLGGEKAQAANTWNCNVFMCRGRFENNLGQWTMRFCDFMVDRLGWSFMVCSLCNMGDVGQLRSQQLVFRWDGDKRDVPLSTNVLANQAFCANEERAECPDWWKSVKVMSGARTHDILRCDADEKDALQKLLDVTFKRTLTRDRVPDDDAPDGEEMPYRMELVDAFRSEHVVLNKRLGDITAERWKGDEFDVKTKAGVDGTCLDGRLCGGQGYVFHGTNPSSAMSILKIGFDLNYAGSATGSMFGAGVYTAECSSKSDEYARDDGGNTYPGLLAVLVCRSFIGKPWVSQRPGDFVLEAKRRSLDSIVGDREAKVGTYREFVFFEEGSIYPEYSIIYRRKWDRDQVPPEMVVPTSGTTGRYWQMQAAGGWKNVPAEVNKLLIQAMKDSDIEVNINLGGTEYNFNITEKLGTNVNTGNSVPLRAPMQF